ncbi:MAG: hypothetical protein WAM58_06520 [Candidatus Acidiferrum sp.]
MAVRQRAREIFLTVLATAFTALDESQVQKPTTEKTDADEAGSGSDDAIKEMLQVIDSTVFQIYMAIGVNPRLVRDGLKPATEGSRTILFVELKEILTVLTQPSLRRVAVLAPQTVHHLVEMFTSTVAYDPSLVLQFLANLLRSFNWGYRFDGMAKDEIVKFADIILADHKEIISEAVNAVNLESILALFVDAGWVEATNLLMRLESAVR